MQAKNLLACEDVLNVKDLVDAATRALIDSEGQQEEERREQRQERPIIDEKRFITDEIARFYINNLLAHNLSALNEKARRTTREVSFRTKMDIFSLEQQIDKEEQLLFEWMKQYLIIAVISEMSNQSGHTGLGEFIKTPVSETGDRYFDRHEVLRKGTDQEIREFLFQTVERFYSVDWEEGYGGYSWSRISKVAYEFWKPQSEFPRSALIDQVFDLQHNSGMVFDKDSEMAVQSKQGYTELQMLTEKSDATDIDSLLQNLKPFVEERVYKMLEERVLKFHKIEERVA